MFLKQRPTDHTCNDRTTNDRGVQRGRRSSTAYGAQEGSAVKNSGRVNVRGRGENNVALDIRGAVILQQKVKHELRMVVIASTRSDEERRIWLTLVADTLFAILP